MRDLKDFSASEWLRFLPLQLAFKQARNDLWLAIYKNFRPKTLDLFLRENVRFKNQNIALVVAFEQPWALDWLLRMASRHLTDTTVMVFDNSQQTAARQDIERVCQNHQTPYLALPKNPTRHVNRSHGMAMTWIFHKVIRVIKPRMFAFIDHDMIPVQNVRLSERLGNQPFFGWDRSTDGSTWNLWAGYCMYDFSSVATLKMNFLYDFSRGIDTGGRNWNCLYRNYDRAKLQFAKSRNVDIRDPMTNEIQSVQFIDELWLHLGAISYKNHYKKKLQFYNNLANALDRGITWPQLCDAESESYPASNGINLSAMKDQLSK